MNFDMNAKIHFVKTWSDEDVAELQIEASDGTSKFSNKVYVGHRHLKDTVTELDRFKDQVYGGSGLVMFFCIGTGRV